MTDGEYVLMLALHADVADAAADLAELTAASATTDLVAGSAILRRTVPRTLVQQSGGGTLGYGIGTGMAVGVVAVGVVVGFGDLVFGRLRDHTGVEPA